MKEELSFTIHGIEPHRKVMVDAFGGDGVFMSMFVGGGSCHLVMSFDSARKMIAALQKMVETQKTVEESTT